jgi:hypothetical protein
MNTWVTLTTALHTGVYIPFSFPPYLKTKVKIPTKKLCEPSGLPPAQADFKGPCRNSSRLGGFSQGNPYGCETNLSLSGIPPGKIEL